jgi:hypothetical protein
MAVDGEDGLLAQLTKIVLESSLQGELDAHRGDGKHDSAGRDGGNSRNGRQSAAYKGVYALLMQAGCEDWLKNKPLALATFCDMKIDIHHVFPKDWCIKTISTHSAAKVSSTRQPWPTTPTASSEANPPAE